MKQRAGFTLIELMMTVLIAAILMGLAVPAFKGLVASDRTVAEARALQTAMNRARSEAIKRGTSVTVTAKNGGGGNNDEWGTGWQVQEGGTVLGDWDAVGGEISADSNNGNIQITFASSGSANPDDTIEFCGAANYQGDERAVEITPTGQARVIDHDC